MLLVLCFMLGVALLLPFHATVKAVAYVASSVRDERWGALIPMLVPMVFLCSNLAAQALLTLTDGDTRLLRRWLGVARDAQSAIAARLYAGLLGGAVVFVLATGIPVGDALVGPAPGSRLPVLWVFLLVCVLGAVCCALLQRSVYPLIAYLPEQQRTVPVLLLGQSAVGLGAGLLAALLVPDAARPLLLWVRAVGYFGGAAGLFGLTAVLFRVWRGRQGKGSAGFGGRGTGSQCKHEAIELHCEQEGIKLQREQEVSETAMHKQEVTQSALHKQDAESFPKQDAESPHKPDATPMHKHDVTQSPRDTIWRVRGGELLAAASRASPWPALAVVNFTLTLCLLPGVLVGVARPERLGVGAFRVLTFTVFDAWDLVGKAVLPRWMPVPGPRNRLGRMAAWARVALVPMFWQLPQLGGRVLRGWGDGPFLGLVGVLGVTNGWVNAVVLINASRAAGSVADARLSDRLGTVMGLAITCGCCLGSLGGMLLGTVLLGGW